ncbi:mannose-1-phosphate guanylyltransferase [soil metagenome]
MNRFVIIMAGGSGERFWPSSRMRKPKQLLQLTSSTQTMLEEAVSRIEPLIPRENIIVITSELLRQPIIDAMPSLLAENVVAEPAKRNTAPCLALAAAMLQTRSENASMAVLTADHFIGNADAFRRDVDAALTYAEEHQALVTLGIPPTRPETGYGYIEMPSVRTDDRLQHVVRFKEKPSFDVALDYVHSGNYMWNSGMFFWTVAALTATMQEHLPEVGSTISVMTEELRSKNDEALTATFSALPDISIDYGVMERAHNVFVLPASFPWDDVGSWDALTRMRACDASENVVAGDVRMIDTHDSIVVNEATHEHVVTVLGIDGLVIVHTNDATLVTTKDKAQEVKRIVTDLRENGREQFL